MLQPFITTLLVFLISAAPSRFQPFRNLVQDSEPLRIDITILNEALEPVSSFSRNFLYTDDEPQTQQLLTFPAGPSMGNYSIRAQVFRENIATPLYSITNNLTRYAIIKKGNNNEALMLEMGATGQQVGENATYGLHIPTRFSVLVIHMNQLIPSENIGTYKRMFNFLASRTALDNSFYVTPVDLSQLMVPYKTYKPVSAIAEGPYNMTVEIKVYPMFYYSLFFGFSRPHLMREAVPYMGEIYSDDVIDMFKEALFTNNLYLVIAYFTLSFIQIFMNIFAFKNQIAVWKKVQEKGGLSIKALYQQLICQVIVCLYLIDNDSNKLFLAFSALNMVLTVWKVMRAVDVTRTQSFPYLSLGYKPWYHKKEEKIDTNAIHYTSYLTAVLFVVFLAYKIYAFWTSETELQVPSLRQAYSLSLNLAVGFIMVFGFVLMTPQLYINYKLKSVDHLPWKTLIYRFISTIIDDVFVFMIDLPTMQRLFSFRDDIIFVLYLYQRWIYKVDPSRKAHPEDHLEDHSQPLKQQ